MSVDTRELSAAARLELDGPPVLVGRQGDRELNDQLFQPVWQKTRQGLAGAAHRLRRPDRPARHRRGLHLATGIGVWGNNIPVGWAFDIINFVWWIGIGHAGTLI